MTNSVVIIFLFRQQTSRSFRNSVLKWEGKYESSWIQSSLSLAWKSSLSLFDLQEVLYVPGPLGEYGSHITKIRGSLSCKLMNLNLSRRSNEVLREG